MRQEFYIDPTTHNKLLKLAKESNLSLDAYISQLLITHTTNPMPYIIGDTDRKLTVLKNP